MADQVRTLMKSSDKPHMASIVDLRGVSLRMTLPPHHRMTVRSFYRSPFSQTRSNSASRSTPPRSSSQRAFRNAATPPSSSVEEIDIVATTRPPSVILDARTAATNRRHATRYTRTPPPSFPPHRSVHEAPSPVPVVPVLPMPPRVVLQPTTHSTPSMRSVDLGAGGGVGWPGTTLPAPDSGPSTQGHSKHASSASIDSHISGSSTTVVTSPSFASSAQAQQARARALMANFPKV